MKVKTQKDIPADWQVFNVRKNTTVKIRPCNGIEKFKVSWQDSELTSDPELDLIVIQPNGKEYPCKADIFWETYEAKREDIQRGLGLYVPGSVFDYEYIKKAITQIVAIPENISVEIETLEGTLNEVRFPDYIAIGAKGELYANTAEFVEKNLEIIK